jgi:hypothetical protein
VHIVVIKSLAERNLGKILAGVGGSTDLGSAGTGISDGGYYLVYGITDLGLAGKFNGLVRTGF